MTAENSDSGEVLVRPIVNGMFLQKYIGKTVTLIGQVISTNPNGSSFDVKTPDLQIVIVSLRKPLMEPVTGLVEIHGIVKGKNSIICDYMLAFPSEIGATYDPDLTNEATTLIHSVPNPWTDE